MIITRPFGLSGRAFSCLFPEGFAVRPLRVIVASLVILLLSLAAAGSCVFDGLQQNPFHAHGQTRQERLVVENASVPGGGHAGDHRRATHCHQDVATLARYDLPIRLEPADVMFSRFSRSLGGYVHPVAVRPPIEAA